MKREERTRGAMHLLALVLGLAWLVQGAYAAPPQVRKLFADPSLTQVAVSPEGEWIAGVIHSKGEARVVVQQVGVGDSYLALRASIPIDEILWVGPNTLFVSHRESAQRGTFLRFAAKDSKMSHEALAVQHRGYMVSALPEQDEVVLWASRHRGHSQVHRISAENLSSLIPIPTLASRSRAKKVASERGRVTHWVTDASGAIRASLEVSEGGDGSEFEVRYREKPSGGWKSVWKGNDPLTVPYPVAFTADGQRLVMSAFAGRNTRGLHEFDPRTREYGATIAARDDVDIVSAIVDEGEVVAAVYVVGGHHYYHYLKKYPDRIVAGSRPPLPDETVHVTSSDRAREIFSVLVSGPRTPGVHYLHVDKTNEWIKLGEVMPGIDGADLVGVESMKVTSFDGTSVEAFLSLPTPRDGRRPPLLVLPHGGPIGVRDDSQFDPLRQWLAMSGIAVLQVNYRGSAGYGRQFLEAGKAQWGQGIERDIDAAVEAVIARGEVDAGRICIAGGSYGGYSALISAVQQPERYRCVVTINGVTDIPLMFQERYLSMTPAGRAAMAEIMGNPEEELEHLLSVSPVYQVDRLEAPVLIVQGDRDRTVDQEHAYRLRAMLQAHDKPHEWRIVRGMGHSPAGLQWVVVANAMKTFLAQHIGPLSPHAPAR